MLSYVGSFPGHGQTLCGLLAQDEYIWVHAEIGRRSQAPGTAVQLPVGYSTTWCWDNKEIRVHGDVQSTESGVALFTLNLENSCATTSATFQSTYAPHGACTDLLAHLKAEGIVQVATKLNAWQIFYLQKGSHVWEDLRTLRSTTYEFPPSLHPHYEEPIPQGSHPSVDMDAATIVHAQQQACQPDTERSSFNSSRESTPPSIPRCPRTTGSRRPRTCQLFSEAVSVASDNGEQLQVAEAELLEGQTRLNALLADMDEYRTKLQHLSQQVVDLQGSNTNLTQVISRCPGCCSCVHFVLT
jgi:hypothetical protein